MGVAGSLEGKEVSSKSRYHQAHRSGGYPKRTDYFRCTQTASFSASGQGSLSNQVASFDTVPVCNQGIPNIDAETETCPQNYIHSTYCAAVHILTYTAQRVPFYGLNNTISVLLRTSVLHPITTPLAIMALVNKTEKTSDPVRKSTCVKCSGQSDFIQQKLHHQVQPLLRNDCQLSPSAQIGYWVGGLELM